jgi:hypothetical protein
LASTPTAPVPLKSPFTGEVILMTFEPGVPPTLEGMLAAGFTRVEPEGKSPRKRKAEEDVDG